MGSFRRCIHGSAVRAGVLAGLGICCLGISGCRKTTEEGLRETAAHAGKSGLRQQTAAPVPVAAESREVEEALRVLRELSPGELREAAFFKSPGPLDHLLARLSPGEFLDLAERAGFPARSNELASVVEKYMAVKMKADPAACRAFLLERQEPWLTTCAIPAFANDEPEMGVEVIEKTVEVRTSRDVNLNLLITRATVADPLRALDLAGNVQDAEERGPLVVVALGEASECQTYSMGKTERPVVTAADLVSVLGRHLEVYGDGSRENLLLRAGKILLERPVAEVAPQIDSSLEWQRQVMLGYLESRATKRQGGEDVRSYLESPAGSGYSAGEREKILAREGAGD